MYGDTLHCKWHLGMYIVQYFQVHEYEDPRNSQLSRTKCSICIGPSVNEQEGVWFMSINSAKISLEVVGTPSWCLTLSYPVSTSYPTMNQIILSSHTAAVVLLETFRSHEWILILLVATKIRPHKTLLTSSKQHKRYRSIQPYQIPTFNSSSTTVNPHNRYSHLSNRLKIPSQSQSNHPQ